MASFWMSSIDDGGLIPNRTEWTGKTTLFLFLSLSPTITIIPTNNTYTEPPSSWIETRTIDFKNLENMSEFEFRKVIMKTFHRSNNIIQIQVKKTRNLSTKELRFAQRKLWKEVSAVKENLNKRKSYLRGLISRANQFEDRIAGLKDKATTFSECKATEEERLMKNRATLSEILDIITRRNLSQSGVWGGKREKQKAYSNTFFLQRTSHI